MTSVTGPGQRSAEGLSAGANRGSIQTARLGRYSSRGEDRHPPLPASGLLMIPSTRPGRIISRKTTDECATTTYGDAIIYKAPGTIRFFFQNVKGLTYSASGEDYNYYASCMSSYDVDCFGMAERNTGWQHHHLQRDFRAGVRRQFKYAKVAFGYSSEEVDLCHPRETFQAGGSLQTVRGNLTTTVQGDALQDPTGLGRWCGMTFEGKGTSFMSVLTAYRVCEGSITNASIGRAHHREYEYFRSKGENAPQPRTRFLQDLEQYILQLQAQDHAILLMMDANSDMDTDKRLVDMISACGLFDLHQSSPAPSTYIGTNHRRIDYMFGCSRVRDGMSRQGTLSYFEGPQSDHRGLYVDLKVQEILSTDLELATIAPSIKRHLHSSNPELVEIYLDSMRKYYDDHNMHQRIERLLSEHKNLSRMRVRQLLQEWDDDQGRAMKCGEKALQQRINQYKWSPKLRNAGVLMRYWKLRLRKHL